MTGSEQEELLALGTGPRLDYDRTKTVVDLFREQVAQTPDAVAVVDCESQITYRALDEQSNAIAHLLIEANGVKPNDFVAVMLPRRKEFVVAVLGIWKAGAAYIPIDTSLPEQRKSFILSDSNAKAVITPETVQRLKESPVTAVNRCSIKDAAYVIYTSGSTGLPKGTVVGHRAFANFTAWANGSLNQRASSKHLVYASFSFDISVIEMLCPLAVGGETHILNEEDRTDLTAVAGYVNEKKINGATFPTSVGMILLNDFDLSLEYAVLAGEKMHPVRKSKIKVFNDYGPCEFCAGSTVYEVRGDETEIPIGRPFPNCRAKICNADGQLIPRGQVGELYLGGVQMGMGYINRPELNEEKYVEGWYRTGDLCRWNSDGLLEYIGRIDNQVKLRGYRIEPGEVESAALRQDGVKQAAAVVKDDRLVLYYTGEKIEDDRFTMRYSQLPEYMVPSAFVHLDAMPMTPSGKIDRKNLPDAVIKSTVYEAPASTLEQRIYNIATQQLGCTDFGVVNNLISYGLTSLKAMRLNTALAASGIDIRVAEILLHPTIRDMAEEVRNSTKERMLAPYRLHEYRAFYPLTANQRLLYLAWLRNKNTVQYNMSYA